MRHKFPICFLLFAWLCANGAICSVVCTAKRSCAEFDGASSCQAMKASCGCCGEHGNHCEGCLAEAEPIKEPTTQAAVVGEGIESFFLIAERAPDFGLAVPLGNWPDIAHDGGLTRTEPVPVPPPRA